MILFDGKKGSRIRIPIFLSHTYRESFRKIQGIDHPESSETLEKKKLLLKVDTTNNYL